MQITIKNGVRTIKPTQAEIRCLKNAQALLKELNGVIDEVTAASADGAQKLIVDVLKVVAPEPVKTATK